ncbi:MAG: uroporphyrinogen decarboxylase family protein [Dysgonamonadaceae bacterium]|jgi:uroporphyrinogen decarboxylase|nr:uroporphyrinogen decarboxylase family protein [Dysgonamonadaceae bacterium]
MTDTQWKQLLSIIKGEPQTEIPAGFIIDCPWLPKWYGISLVDYFSNDELWLKANFAAIDAFPDVMFFPGFWSEYGMCTEPSAFGAKCTFWKNEFPFASKTIQTVEEIDNLEVPDPETDGLLPFMLNRLALAQPAIEAKGHKIRFSVSRGPLNIASFLMGTTEFMMAIVLEPERVHRLMRIITDFLKRWHEIQRQTFPSIDGIMMLDDIVGFISEEDFLEFGFPYIKEINDAANVNVKLFHNDADFRVSVKHYPAMGVNLYNPGIYMDVNEIKEEVNNGLTVLGSIPPRDVLAMASPEEVGKATSELLNGLKDTSRFILSCAGGMPPNVSTENLNALLQANKAFQCK